MFDKQIQLRMGQANVKRWVRRHHAAARPTRTRSASTTFATHRLPLDEAPHAYEIFQKKQDGAIKVVLKPELVPPRRRTSGGTTSTTTQE